jgi:AhpD family alkylhydroperoxidase
VSFFSFLKLEDGFPEILRSDLETYAPVIQLVGTLMAPDASSLVLAERELILSYVAAKNACDFCVGFHRAAAVGGGLDEAVVAQVLERDAFDLLPEHLRPCLRLARQLTLEPGKTREAEVAAVVEKFDERTAQHVITLVALMNFANRMVSGHGVVGSAQLFSLVERQAANGGLVYGGGL